MSISSLIQHAKGPAHAPALYQDSNIARTAPQGSEWQGVRSRGSKSLGPILTSARPELACVLALLELGRAMAGSKLGPREGLDPWETTGQHRPVGCCRRAEADFEPDGKQTQRIRRPRPLSDPSDPFSRPAPAPAYQWTSASPSCCPARSQPMRVSVTSASSLRVLTVWPGGPGSSCPRPALWRSLPKAHDSRRVASLRGPAKAPGITS